MPQQQEQIGDHRPWQPQPQPRPDGFLDIQGIKELALALRESNAIVKRYPDECKSVVNTAAFDLGAVIVLAALAVLVVVKALRRE